MRTSADVVIIGAGVTGAALAYTLAKRGIRNVLVLERRFPCAGATGRCGGGIRQQFTSESNIRLAMGSVRIYEELSEELDYDIEYVQGAYLVLAETEQELELQRQAVALQNELGLPSHTLAPEHPSPGGGAADRASLRHLYHRRGHLLPHRRPRQSLPSGGRVPQGRKKARGGASEVH